MTDLGAYTFLPHLRQGLGTRITGTGGGRATITVALELTGEGLDGTPQARPVTRTVQLLGPGDVVGLDPRAVIRTDPRPGAGTFEPNFLAHVELYDEDLPWRYSPVAAAGERLLPWLALVVLAEGEFDEITGAGRPLPAIRPRDLALLPPADDLWAWAHVHVNGALATPVVSRDAAALATATEAVVRSDPDRAYSRVLCPRRLEPRTRYHAFLVPAFETGRLAGVGLDPAGAASPTTSAWAQLTELPVLFRWSFGTGVVGDFEHLVRLLRPRPADDRVGRKAMDTTRPGSGLDGAAPAPGGGVLHTGGALRVPGTAAFEEDWDVPGPHPWQQRLASLLNLPEDAVAGGGDPVVAPPVYGRWHALTPRADPAAAGWVHELNLDPRHRVAAGLGTRVVQREQEDLMAAAWAQVGDVLAANRAIRLAQAGIAVGRRWFAGTVVALEATRPERAALLTAPVQARVLAGGRTIRAQVRDSALPLAAVSAPMRRLARPGGPLVRGLGQPVRRVEAVVGALAAGRASAAPPRPTPPGLATAEQLAGAVAPPTALERLAGRRRLRRLGCLGWLAAAPVQAALRAARPGRPLPLPVPPARVLHPARRTPEAIGRLPRSPDFRPTEPGTEPVFSAQGEDGDAARRFKQSLVELHELREAAHRAGGVEPPPPLDLRAATGAVTRALDPARAVPRRLAGVVQVPPRLAEPLRDEVAEVMAHPVIDLPMAVPLAALSPELLLPNIDLLERDSITLLEANQRFVESYLVGANHELARELLWREFPTDQRGTPLRQFWDVREQLTTAPDRDALRDIPALHTWDRASALGTHDHRERGVAQEDELVLTIRGELLRRYPNAVVYAHKADWARTPDGRIDRAQPRRLAPLPAGADPPPRALVQLPLFRMPVPPDIDLFGFDLTEGAVRGRPDASPPDPGWFFVIKERPGEPRFGLDVDSDLAPDALTRWDELAWEHAAAEGARFLRPDRTLGLRPPASPADPQAQAQHDEDRQVRFGPATSSAELAYVLFQVPVLVAVHASELLRARP